MKNNGAPPSAPPANRCVLSRGMFTVSAVTPLSRTESATSCLALFVHLSESPRGILTQLFTSDAPSPGSLAVGPAPPGRVLAWATARSSPPPRRAASRPPPSRGEPSASPDRLSQTAPVRHAGRGRLAAATQGGRTTAPCSSRPARGGCRSPLARLLSAEAHAQRPWSGKRGDLLLPKPTASPAGTRRRGGPPARPPAVDLPQPYTVRSSVSLRLPLPPRPWRQVPRAGP